MKPPGGPTPAPSDHREPLRQTAKLPQAILSFRDTISSPEFLIRHTVLPSPARQSDTIQRLLLLEQAEYLGWLAQPEVGRRLTLLAPIRFGERLSEGGEPRFEELVSGACQLTFERWTMVEVDGVSKKLTVRCRWHTRVDDSLAPYDPCWVVERGLASGLKQHHEILVNEPRYRERTPVEWPPALTETEAAIYAKDAWAEPIVTTPGALIDCARRDSHGLLWLPAAIHKRLTEILNAFEKAPDTARNQYREWELALSQSILPASHFPCVPHRDVLGVWDEARLKKAIDENPPPFIRQVHPEESVIIRNLHHIFDRPGKGDTGRVDIDIPHPFKDVVGALLVAAHKSFYAPQELAAPFSQFLRTLITADAKQGEFCAFLRAIAQSRRFLSSTRVYALEALSGVAPALALDVVESSLTDRSRLFQLGCARFLNQHAPERFREFCRRIPNPSLSQRKAIDELEVRS